MFISPRIFEQSFGPIVLTWHRAPCELRISRRSDYMGPWAIQVWKLVIWRNGMRA